MAIKSLLLLGVVMASVLLICQDLAYARVLAEANGMQGKNVEPERVPKLEGEKWFVGGHPGFEGGYRPAVYGPGYPDGVYPGGFYPVGVYPRYVPGGFGGGIEGYGGPGYTGTVFPGGAYPDRVYRSGVYPGYVRGVVPPGY